jgi:RNA polymerase sigma-70 factor (sigma-E family)
MRAIAALVQEHAADRGDRCIGAGTLSHGGAYEHMDGNSTTEDDGFTQFVVTARPGLRRSAYLLCGDWHEAEDLTQNALLAVLRRWDKLRWPDAAAGYARAAMYRIFISERRHVRWRLETTHAEVPEPDRASADGDGDGDGSENSIADRIVLLEALGRLPPRQRAAVMLRYIEDLDVTRTAEILECEPSTIRSQTARALATMRLVMTNHR